MMCSSILNVLVIFTLIETKQLKCFPILQLSCIDLFIAIIVQSLNCSTIVQSFFYKHLWKDLINLLSEFFNTLTAYLSLSTTGQLSLDRFIRIKYKHYQQILPAWICKLLLFITWNFSILLATTSVLGKIFNVFQIVFVLILISGSLVFLFIIYMQDKTKKFSPIFTNRGRKSRFTHKYNG